MNVNEFTQEFQTWFEGAKSIVENHYANTVTKTSLRYTEGPRYIKIISYEVESDGQRGSAFAFIGRSNGDVLKSDSWVKPAKHARGNIFDEHNGLRWVGPYGMAYLR